MTTLTTTGYEPGDVVLVRFPFTDQRGVKQRPAVVVSSPLYNTEQPDLILLAVTGQFRESPPFGEVVIQEWRRAGLLKPSVLKPVVFTVEKPLIQRRLGRLRAGDRATLQTLLTRIIAG